MADETHRAEQARRLLSDELFAEALTEVRTDALVALASVDASDTLEILRLQAIARCTEAIRDYLEAAITRSGARDGGLSLTATRTANKAN